MNADFLLSRLDSAGYTLARYLVAVLWQSTLLLTATGLLAWALRRHRPAMRHALWMLALLATPALPLLTRQASRLGAPQAPVEVLPTYHSAAPAPLVPRGFLPADSIPPSSPTPAKADQGNAGGVSAGSTSPKASSENIRTSTPDKALATPAPPAPPPVNPWAYPWAWALAAYLAGLAAMLTLMLAGTWRLRRWLRAAAHEDDPRVLGIFERAARRLNLATPFQVLTSEQVAAPLSMGLLRIRVLLPRELSTRLDDTDLQAVALHELAHGRRRDPLWLTVAALLRAIFFFHPLVWLAARRAAALAEHCADEAVLAATGLPLPYAKMLARLAEGLPLRAPACELATGLVSGRGAFVRRIEAILAHRSSIRGMTRLGLTITAIAVLGVVLVVLAVPLAERGPRQSSLYEKARGSGANLSVKAGPNRFKVKAVVRSDRNGNEQYEDGRGRPVPKSLSLVMNTPRECEAWLDAADIHFGIDSEDPRASQRYDVIEVRVFDHATRQPLEPSQGYEAVGHDLTGEGVVRLNAMGQPLPQAVDLWLRVNSYPDNARWSLPPQAGKSISLNKGTLTVLEARAGSWSTKVGGDQLTWLSGPQYVKGKTTIAFQWRGDWKEGKWFICAVNRHNRRVWSEVLDFTGQAAEKQVCPFDLPLDEIAYLELRRVGGRHAIYFDNVRLPAAVQQRLLPPPPVRFELAGKPGKFVSSSLAPIDCSLEAGIGNGSMQGYKCADAYRPYAEMTSIPNTEDYTHFIYEIPGLQLTGHPTLVAFDRSGAMIPQDQAPMIEYGYMGNQDFSTGLITIKHSLDDIGAIDLYIDKDPMAWNKLRAMLASNDGNNIQNGAQRLLAGLRQGRNFDEALNFIRGDARNRGQVAWAMQNARDGFSDDQLRKIADLLFELPDPLTFDRLVTIFQHAPNRPGALKQVARLAASEKPWLWLPPLAGDGASTTLKRLADAGLLTPQMKLRAAVLGEPGLVPGLKPTAEETTGVLAGILTPRFLQLDYPHFWIAFKKTADGFGPRRATPIFTGFIKQLLAEWDQWQVDGRARNNDKAVDDIARHLNLWHGTYFGGLGSNIHEDTYTISDEGWKAIAEEIARWAETGADPGKPPAGDTAAGRGQTGRE